MAQQDNDQMAEKCGREPVGQFTVEDQGQDVLVFGTLPGFDPQELVLEVKEGSLWVNAISVDGKTRHSQTVPLPPGVAPGPVRHATLINGVLEMRLPKETAAANR